MWWKIVLFAVISCVSSQTTSFDIGGVLSGNRMAGIPLGHTLGGGELDVEGICQRTGVACRNCTHMVTCIQLPLGWLKVPLMECDEGLTCNAHIGQCTNQAVPECDIASQKFEHTCEQVGIFPDAHDCRKFHLCSPPEGLPYGSPAQHRVALCPLHYGYNPQTAQCSIKLKDGQCSQKPVPDCAKVGQTGSLASSPNHYYVCLSKHQTLYPQIFICPHGWYFWGGFCRPEPEVIVPTERTTTNPAVQSRNRAEETTVKAKSTTAKIDSFFSTEKATTYAADSFLADKFDLANYESTDDVQPSFNYEFPNSFEREDFSW